MESKPKDITQKERELLRIIRSHPGIYTGRRGNITDIRIFISGMKAAVNSHNPDDICIIPDGFTGYLAEKYNKSRTIDWATIIQSISTDEYTAFSKFWELLNEYLSIYGYEPIEAIEPDYNDHIHDDGITEIFFHDIPQVAASYIKTFNSAPWNDTWNKETAVNRIKELFYPARPYRRCIWKDNKIIGGLFGRTETYFDGDVFQLVELWIDPEYQGKGYAKQLIDTLKKELAKWEIKRIYLLTMHGESTEGFYLHNGFTTSGDMCVMELDIN